MKKLLSLCLSFVAFAGFVSSEAAAQCIYTAVANGNFSSASTFASTCGGAPTPGSDDIIIINGFNVILDVNYQVGRNGSLTIGGGGSLIGGADLGVGDGRSSQAATNLTIGPGSTLRVAQLTVDKATVTISAPTVATAPTKLTTDCNLVLVNSAITDNGQAIINGSIDLTRGGANNTLCGTGSVQITGCVFGSNGQTNRLADNCASSLITVCAQKQNTGCPGPQEASNASQLECQNIITCATAPLPVELAVFTATPTSRNGVALHWTTASEKNSKQFIIERSANSEAFHELSTVAAAGNTQHYTTYDQVDAQPLPGTSYYRLRQVDYDGSSTYSPVRAVKLGTSSSESLAVYPGRTATEWIVSTTIPADFLVAPTSVQVYDALGRQHQVPTTTDASQPGRWVLNLQALPTGVYIVRLVSLGGTFSQRIAQ